MLIKVVLLFLVVMGILGMFGRLRFGAGRQRPKIAVRCGACGRPRIGTGPCACGDAG